MDFVASSSQPFSSQEGGELVNEERQTQEGVQPRQGEENGDKTEEREEQGDGEREKQGSGEGVQARGGDERPPAGFIKVDLPPGKLIPLKHCSGFCSISLRGLWKCVHSCLLQCRQAFRSSSR